MDEKLLFREFGKEIHRAYERASATLPHYGERALERENALATLLNHRIPTRFQAARGFILFGNEVYDKQIDCLVYDSFTYGNRSNLSGNVMALSKSVAAIFFETLTLSRKKFEEDIDSIERLKKRFESDTSYDPYSNTFLTQPLAFIVAYKTGLSWDVLQAYQDEFMRLYNDGERWRHVVDGIFLVDPGEFLYPVAQYKNEKRLHSVVLSNVTLASLPDETIIGLSNTNDPENAGDRFFETLRSYLMCFKNPTIPNDKRTVPLQINLPISGEEIRFMRCFKWPGKIKQM